MKKTDSQQQNKKHHSLTIFAALLAMIGPFSIDTYLPSFPEIETTFAISRSILSQSMGIYLLAFAFSTLIWGPLSDKLGRRLVIQISLLIYILASAACALADNFHFFVFMRFIQGLSASGGFIAGRAMIRDAHDADSAHHAMSQVTMLFVIAPAIAPLLGGWLQDQFGWRSIFWFLCIFALVLILLGRFIEESLEQKYRQSLSPTTVIINYTRTFKHKQFMKLVFSLSFSFAGLFIYIVGSPTIIYDFLNLGSDKFSLQYIPMVGGMMTGAFISAQLAKRWQIQKTTNVGFSIMLSAISINLIFVNFFPASPFYIIFPMVVYALGLSIVLPAVTILALDCFPHHRGLAASALGFVQMLINTCVASIIIPLIHNQWLHYVFGQILFLLLGLLLWYQFIVNKGVNFRPD
ncbi:MAG: multidrug effflux MFS transporter [Methylococcales bacterium]